MADFCKQCSLELFGKDYGDLAKLLPEDQFTWDTGASTICEGCGWITVDYEGKCCAISCEKHGKENTEWFENERKRRSESNRSKDVPTES